MAWFANLRLIVLARRGVIALESIAASLAFTVDRERRESAAAAERASRPPKILIDNFDPVAANELYREDQRARGILGLDESLGEDNESSGR